MIYKDPTDLRERRHMSFRADKWLGAAVFCAAILSSTVPAAAISITNRDEKDHKLTILEDDGAKKADHTLKPNQVLENICMKGCVIRLNDSEEDEYELVEGNEIVSIEDGYLYYDQPDDTPAQGGQPAAGATPATPPPATPEKKQ